MASKNRASFRRKKEQRNREQAERGARVQRSERVVVNAEERGAAMRPVPE